MTERIQCARILVLKTLLKKKKKKKVMTHLPTASFHSLDYKYIFIKYSYIMCVFENVAVLQYIF